MQSDASHGTTESDIESIATAQLSHSSTLL
jgi:hypothetical protein